MEGSAHKVAKQDDVQFGDDNLRGETWKYHNYTFCEWNINGGEFLLG